MKTAVVYEGTYMECQMLQHLLLQNGIISFLNNEITGSRGGINVMQPRGVRIMISETDLEKAVQIVADFRKD